MSVMSDVEVLRAACCVAGLDHRIDESEQRILESLAHRAGVGHVSLQAMIDRALSDPDFFEEQFRLLNTDADAAMKTLLCVAIADRELTDDERIVLQHFAEVLGMDAKRYEHLLRAAQKYMAELKAKDKTRGQ